MAALGWWIEATMVWPSAVRQDMWSMMFSAAKASRPVVGSSRNSSDGLPTSAQAMPSRLRSPPAVVCADAARPWQAESCCEKKRPMLHVPAFLTTNVSYCAAQAGGQGSLPLRPRTIIPPARMPPTCNVTRAICCHGYKSCCSRDAAVGKSVQSMM